MFSCISSVIYAHTIYYIFTQLKYVLDGIYIYIYIYIYRNVLSFLMINFIHYCIWYVFISGFLFLILIHTELCYLKPFCIILYSILPFRSRLYFTILDHNQIISIDSVENCVYSFSRNGSRGHGGDGAALYSAPELLQDGSLVGGQRDFGIYFLKDLRILGFRDLGFGVFGL